MTTPHRAPVVHSARSAPRSRDSTQLEHMSADLVQATLRVAVAKLRNAADVGTVRSVLMDAIAALAPDGGSTSTGSDAVCTPLCEVVFSQFLDTLLARVLPNWVPCMSTSQREACFDIWFVGTVIPRHFALLALARALGGDTHAGMRIVELLRLLLWEADRGAGDPARGMVQVLELAQASISAASGTAAGEALLGVLVSIPERVANALKMAAPRWSTPERFHAAVAEATWQLFAQADSVSVCGPWIIPMLLSRQARLRQARIVMQVWVPQLLACASALGDTGQHDPNSSTAASAVAVMRSVLEALSGPAFEEVLRSLLACLPPFNDSAPSPSVAHRLLHAMLCQGLQSNDAWRYLLSQKLPTDRALPRTTQGRHSIRYVIDCLLHADLQHRNDANSPRDTLVEGALGSIINVWADPAFAQHSTLDYHRYLTHSMLYCLELMVGHASSAHVQRRLDCEGWMGELMHGVQRRFDSTSPHVRMFGMLVAERLSALINPDNPLCFDEVAAVRASIHTGLSSTTIDPDLRDDVDFFHNRPEAPPSASDTAEHHVADSRSTIEQFEDVINASAEQTVDDRADGSAVVQVHSDDPDAILAPAYNEESSCDSESNDEDAAADDDGETSVASLEAFVVPDGLSKGRGGHRSPKHVREVIAWLRLPKDPTPTDYDRYEAALRNVESLLYNTSDNGVSCGALHDEAKELITLLIHLQDALVEDESDATGGAFVQLRHKAIVSTVVHAPAVACIHLASAVFSENSSMATRLDCLRALEDGSIQLSFPTRRRQRPSHETGDVEPSSAATARSSTSESIQTRPEPKTRRWGHTARIARGEKCQEPIARRNEFSEFAGPVLFTLVAGFEKKGSTADYLRSEPVFVAKLLHCLAVVFEAAGQAPGLSRMAEGLGELCWHLRGHPEASVRRGVLVVFVQLLIASSLGSSTIHGGDAGEWLREVAMEDPDTNCRELAKSCLGSR